MTNRTQTLGPHLTFGEQAADDQDAYPCSCWSAGRGDITGLTREQVQHPEEYDDGAQAAFDEAYDL